MKKSILFSIMFSLCMFIHAQGNKIVINEIMAANVDYVLDPSFNYGSWIELYNPTASGITCEKLYVTDDPADLKKAQVRNWVSPFPRMSYFTIWFDHHDGIFSPDNIDFKLNYDGGTIYVTDGTQILCSQEYPKALGRISYARKTNGGSTWAWTANPTPGKSNATSTFVSSVEKQLAAPVFDTDGCVYSTAFSINLSSPDDADIYYTIASNGDAPTPTKENGIKASKNVTINISGKNYIIRARAYKDGYLPSEVTTHSYIYQNKKYVFPIISIATNKDNLHSSEYGIFEGGNGGWNWGWGWDWGWGSSESNPNGRPGNGQSSKCNWNMDWDRPVNFEYITADGEYALNQEVDMSTCGGWSRAWTPHSFKLKAGKYYMGMNSMDYPFFDNKPNIKHKALQIRNGGNDTDCRIKDAAVQQVVRTSGLRVNTQSWQPAHVFINGEFHGTLNMREPNNKHFAYSNYGYDTDELDQFEISPDSCYVQKAGTDEKFLEWYELSKEAEDETAYAKICDIVDIEEYINYMAVELYICTGDWARNNVKGFRSRNNGKFHFVLFDLDSTGETSSPFTTLAGKKNFSGDQLYGINGVTPWSTGDRVNCENKFVSIFINMLKNENFRHQFVDTYCIVAGSVFNPTRVKTVVNDLSKYLNTGLSVDGKSSTSSANYIINTLSADHQTNMINNLRSYTPMGLKSATSTLVHLKSNIDEGEIFINGIKVPTGAMDGRVFKPYVIRAAAPEGYRFEGWYNTIGDTFVSEDIEMEVTANSPRYTAKWTKMTEEEMIAENVNCHPVVINEVSASNDIYVNELYKKADWIELYNNSEEEVNIAGMYLTDNPEKTKKFQIPTDDVTLNTIIPAHGHKIVWCDKKESGSKALHADFKLEADSGYVAIFNYDGETLIYADSVRYDAHDAYHSVGRYPDGGAFGYLMPMPSPGTKNICGTDVMPFIQAQPVVTDIETVKVEQHADIAIAYVGQGILNIKSSNGNIGHVAIYSTSGTMAKAFDEQSNFASLNISDLGTGVFIVKVGGKVLKFRK